MERLLLLLFMGVLFFSCSDSSINKESNNTTQNMEQRSLPKIRKQSQWQSQLQ